MLFIKSFPCGQIYYVIYKSSKLNVLEVENPSINYETSVCGCSDMQYQSDQQFSSRFPR